MRINLIAFKGRLPIVSDRLLPDNNATVAKDCDLRSGEIRPLHESSIVQTMDSNKWETLYRHYGKWLLFEGDADVISSPVIDDVWKRICFTSDKLEQPMMSYEGMIPNNGLMQAQGYKLGIPAPEDVITVSPNAVIEVDIEEVYNERPIRIKTRAPHGLKTNETVQFSITSEGTSGSSSSNDKKSDLSLYLNEGVFQVSEVKGKPDELTLNYTDAANVKYSKFLNGVIQQYFNPAQLEATFYVFTYVSELGEEGPPSDLSEQVDVGQTQVVILNLPRIETNLNVGRNITKRRIYRSVAGTGVALFLYVGEVGITDTTFTDDILTGNLGEALPSLEYDPPHERMRGLRVASQGFCVGFYDNVVCFSEPYLPHAWPTTYQIAVEHEVVAVETLDNGIVVGTKGRPYIIQGVDPRSMLPKRLENNYACISKQSMATLGYAVIYATTQGLVMIQGGRAVLVTQGILTEQQWAEYQPETIKGFAYNDMYVAFYGSGNRKGGFIFNPKSAEIGFIDLTDWAKNGFVDPEEKYLYLLDGKRNIVRWNDDAMPTITYTWKSKVVGSLKPNNMSCAKVKAASYPLTFKLYADGNLKYTKLVSSPDPFVLPNGYSAREWQIEVEGKTHVQDIQVSDTYMELE